MSATIPPSGKVRNPKTNRLIEIGKGTYNQLIKEGYVLVGTTLQHPPSSGKEEDDIGGVTSQLSSLQISKPQLQPQLQPQSQETSVNISSVRFPGGEVPQTESLQQEFLESITQDRTDMCNVCSSYYLKRISNLQPFTSNQFDYKLLKQTIVPACERCESLLNQEIRLKGRDPNSFEIYRRYKQAAIKSRETLGRVESDIRASGIALASQGTMDPGIFFPKTPDIDPRQ